MTLENSVIMAVVRIAAARTCKFSPPPQIERTNDCGPAVEYSWK